MTSIQPIQYSQEASGGGLISLGLGFLVLMYFMYDHFEKRLRLQAELNEGTEARFRVTEDRLATLNEIEEDVRALTEAEEERKSSWEDDVTEPGKYQAILGTMKYEGSDIQYTFSSDKFHTFKENRYWILNTDINFNTMNVLSNKCWGGSGICGNEITKITSQEIVGLDNVLHLELTLPTVLWSNKNVVQDRILNEKFSEIKWRRVLLNA